ncbi:MAG: sulfide/dihydroorotate dehydrogenase-like FAD/NAD-binding protein [Alistipes sp.]|nr:sulfide/dihydroorotate dehydrogenase-like FAD/NAD-binding protein [Candidatus Alistipes equi]
MFEIINTQELATGIFETTIHAPRVAKVALPGQFLIVRNDEHAERIPLTIADCNPADGTVTIVTQALGVSTKKITSKSKGEYFQDVTGPLGRPSEFVHMSDEELSNKRYIFIGGGVGTAPVYPQVKYLHDKGAKVDVIIGAKTKDMLIYTERMKAVADNVYIATDDGSEGFHGLVTALLEKLIQEGKTYDECVAIGPMIMMKFVSLTTKKFSLKCTVSLNAMMIDGTGMCGACRVTIGGKMKFTCVDGPEFNAYEVDFDEAMRRSGMYRKEEAQALERFLEKNHKCNIGLR